MRRVSSCLIAAVCFSTTFGIVASAQAVPAGGRGVGAAHGAGGSVRAGFGVRGTARPLPTGAGFSPVGSAGETLAFSRYGAGSVIGPGPSGFNGFGGGRSNGYAASAFGYGGRPFGNRGYGSLFGYGGCFDCGGSVVQQTVLPGAPGLPSAAGVREAPVSPPAIYVIGARTRPGRHAATARESSKIAGPGPVVGNRPDLAAAPAAAPKIIRLDARS